MRRFGILFEVIILLCCASVSAEALNITVYVVPAITDNKILPNSTIAANYKTDNITLSAAKGEYEPASFVINSDGNVSSLMIEATNLTGMGGTISAVNVDIKTVKVWWQAGAGIKVSDPAHEKQLTPELLLKDDSLVRFSGEDNYLKLSNGTEVKISDPAGIAGVPSDPASDQFPVEDSDTLLPVNLPKSYNKQFWITVKVPDDAVAGQYLGKIYMKDSTQTLKEIALAVNVLPIKLSNPILEYSMYYGGWPSNYPTIHTYYKSVEQYAAEMEDMASHGVKNPNTWFVSEQILSIRNSSGINNSNVYHSGFWITHENDTGFREKISLYKEMAENAGVENYYIYGVDEVDLNTSAYRARISAAHQAGAKVFCAEYMSVAKNSIADALDLLIASGPPDQALAMKYHSYGHRIFSYDNPQGGVEMPETYRRNYGLLLWQKDYDGAMDFAYQWAFNNTWDDFDYFSGVYYRDHNFVYPTVDGVIDTVQWEGFREGVDDVRYLSTLLDRVAYAKSIGLNVSSVEEWVGELKAANLSEMDLDNVRRDIVARILSLPEQVCSSNEVSGCKVCKSDGSAWTDNSSRCPAGQTCVNGNCSASTTTSTTTTTTSTSSSSSTSTTSTTIPQCLMAGNGPPCSEVALSEVVGAINQWAADELDLGEIISLINSWADPMAYPPD